MAGKKGQVVQLQTEVNTEEEWQALLEKEGLTVADIYAGWCGPCVGMIGNLKKIKLDYGGEVLHLAIVKSDEIEDLKRFRNKSEPTWMFIAAGQLSDLMFGANAPRLQKVMIAEIEKETKAMAGSGARTVHPFDELIEEEQVRFEAAEKIRRQIQAEKEAKEAAANAEQLRKTMEHLVVTLPDYTVLLLMPYFFDIEGAWSSILEEFVEMGLSTADELQIEFEPEQFAELVFSGQEELTEECKEAIAAGHCLLKLIHLKRDVPEEGEDDEPLPMSEPPEDLLFAVYRVVYGNNPPKSGAPKIDPESFAGKYSTSPEVPALWTPQTAFAKAQCVLHYFPDLAEKFAEPIEPPPAPRLALMFDTTRAKEVFEMVKEFGDEVLAVGFFTEENPAEARRIAKTIEDYERRHHHITGDERIVLSVSRVRSDPLLSFSTLQPCYISADIDEGFKDFDAFFPENAEDIPSAVASDTTIFSEVTVNADEVSIYDGYEKAEDVVTDYNDDDEDETLSMLFGPAPTDAVVTDAPADAEGAAEAPPPPEEPIDS